MRTILLFAALFLAGCDQMKERAGFPDPARMEAEGRAIGGACRHAGRGLEDCYRLNDGAAKSAIYAGWKEMNEYMAKNHIEAVAPAMTAAPLTPSEPTPKHKKAAAEEGDTPASEKNAAH